MPVISCSSPKGGVGKSTLSIILATEFAALGVDVVVIDTDPNEAVLTWKAIDPDATPVEVVRENDEKKIVQVIRDLDRDGRVVIIDLEGVASMLNSRAMIKSDLVLICTRAAKVDLDCAQKAAQIISTEEETFERKIHHAVVFTQTPTILTRENRQVVEAVASSGIDIVKPFATLRTHYSLLHSHGGGLRELPEHKSLPKAIEEASAITQAVQEYLIAALEERAGGSTDKMVAAQ